MAAAAWRLETSIGPWRTESLAVGSSGYVERIKPPILSRQETQIVEATTALWVLRDGRIPYGQGNGPWKWYQRTRY